jgi:hypothetical protein
MITLTATAIVVVDTAGRGPVGGKGCQVLFLSRPYLSYLMILDIARTKTNVMRMIVFHPSEKLYLVP